jgi:hypothetical protein
MMKKMNALPAYINPIFLWSTVVNQLKKPVVFDGRRSRPVPEDGAGAITVAI